MKNLFFSPKKWMNGKFLFLSFAVVFFASVTTALAAQIVNQNLYRDAILPISLAIPDGWSVHASGTMAQTRTIILDGQYISPRKENGDQTVTRWLRVEISMEPYSRPFMTPLRSWLGTWQPSEVNVSEKDTSIGGYQVVERIEHPYGNRDQYAVNIFLPHQEKVFIISVYGAELESYLQLISPVISSINFQEDLENISLPQQPALDARAPNNDLTPQHARAELSESYSMPLGARHAWDIYPYSSSVDCKVLGCYWISQGPNGWAPDKGTHLGASTKGALDFITDIGTPVYASRGGTVLIAGKPASGYTGYGNVVVIEHNDLTTTLYAHLSDWNSSLVNHWVDKGTLIGYTGDTGWQDFGLSKAWAPHLHFQARLGDYILDPPVSLVNIQGITWNDTNYYTGYSYGPPVLYHDANFQGKSQAFPESVPSLLIQEYSNGLGNDRASSLDWVYPWSFRMYAHNNYGLPGFRGESDISDFTSHRFSDGTLLNDNVSSVVVAYGLCQKPGIGPINYSSSEKTDEAGSQALSECGAAPSAPPPVAVSLSSPANGQALTSQTVNFLWTDAPEAKLEGYQLLIKTTSDMNAGGSELFNTFTSGNSFTYTFPANNNTLYWSVRPKVSGAYGPWADPFSFGFNKTVPTPVIPPPPQSSGWNQVFYRDNNLSSQCGTRNEVDVYMFRDSDGGWAPPSGCPGVENAWSVRMDRYDAYFEGGFYNFGLFYDDNARLYIDNILKIDGWVGTQHYESYYVSPGYHHLRLEYRNNAGHAIVQLWWQGPGALPANGETQDPQQWWASYWGNRNQWQDSVGRRNEGTGFLDHNWGDGSPGFGLPSDQFSTRFERTVYFPCGTYTFNLNSDDGSRLWIDNQLVPEFDHWVTNVWNTTKNISLLAGNHKLQVDHFENGGGAGIHLNWNLISECPAPVYPTPNPAPFLQFLTPDSTYEGAGNLLLTANGNNFVSGSVVIWDGIEFPSSYVSPTKISATIPRAYIENGAAHSVVVRSPEPGGGDSSPVSFAISPVGPWFTYRHDLSHTGRTIAKIDNIARIKWTFSPGGEGSTPVISSDDRIYIGLGNTLYSLSKKAEVYWAHQVDGNVRSPLVINNRIFFGTGNGFVYSVDGNGNELWSYQTGGWINAAPAIAPDGTIYIGSSDGFFYAFTFNGELKWRTAIGSWINSTPAIGKDGMIYFGSTTGNIYALRSDGNIQWQFPTGSYVDCSPAIGADGTIYIGSWDGYFYALNGQNGAKLWSFQTGIISYASPAINQEGTIYVPTNHDGLYAFKPNGDLLWHYTGDTDNLSSPTLTSDGKIYFGSRSGLFHALDGTGLEIWSIRLGGWLDHGPIFDDDNGIYIAKNSSLIRLTSEKQIYLPALFR